MRRRKFITLLGGAAAVWPLAAIAQQADQVRRIGVLSNIGESNLEAQSMVTALHEELRKLGWIDGRNLRVDHRWAAGNPERATAFAKELVALKPEVIVAIPLRRSSHCGNKRHHSDRVCADFRSEAPRMTSRRVTRRSAAYRAGALRVTRAAGGLGLFEGMVHNNPALELGVVACGNCF